MQGYEEEHNQYLRDQASLNALTNKAFKDTTMKNNLTKPKQPQDTLNFERNVAESYLKEIVPESIIPSILNYLDKTNNFVNFNKYHAVFKRALGTEKITSLGQFTNIFESFIKNVLSDIERTGLFPLEETKRLLQDVSTKTLPTIVSELLEKDEAYIEKEFIRAFISENGFEPKEGDTIEAKGSGNDYIKYTLLDVDKPIMTLRTARGAQTGKTLVQTKIRYILKVNNPNYKIPHSIRWEGRISGSGLILRKNQRHLRGTGIKKNIIQLGDIL